MYMPGAFAIKVSAGGSRIIKPAAERMKVRTFIDFFASRPNLCSGRPKSADRMGLDVSCEITRHGTRRDGPVFKSDNPPTLHLLTLPSVFSPSQQK
ncbi:hypothetical protein FBZ98_104236 [Rhizobium sp. ERR 922]|uniref:Uncharacterized protein n=1 Tax=Rhizobium dioscoreae TaxID=2653122 RepID=A0ABQ0Z6T5_9HYPH|nr:MULTISPECIES: hypothetical protein [Rhizobium]TWB53309.1 hypothetical protein FBZ98_104236 [Rhizobium sp. ERR 922]TWB95727.1 hypothetical protein FBZ97_104415 [Rhizobium sp. ERR 942]GES40855.1 hypothetical protein RsS62_01070 [Rhizobium dioscoreae]GES50983.1 hypothetical protein RsS93_35970 [Rhizobium dioscoreae]GLU82433.1 hypothetical protein Rhsp01_36090 [Rhizobium sp. NBRC 114257]